MTGDHHDSVSDLHQTKPYVRTLVALDDVIDCVKGYINTEYRWNGFLCPGFPLHIAKFIAQLVSGNPSSEVDIVYNESKDVFITTPAWTEYTPIETKGEDILTEDGMIRLYFLGGCDWGWCYSEVSPLKVRTLDAIDDLMGLLDRADYEGNASTFFLKNSTDIEDAREQYLSLRSALYKAKVALGN